MRRQRRKPVSLDQWSYGLLRRLDDVIRRLERDTGRPARTIALALSLGMSERTMRYWLVRLEQKRVIERVGQRGGWEVPGTRFIQLELPLEYVA